MNFCQLFKSKYVIMIKVFQNITRKVFFYGIVSLCFYLPFSPLEIKTTLMNQPVVWGNLLFLGLIASMLCYIMWNYAVKQLGASKAANYIYMVPFSTMLTSNIFLGETFSFISLAGALCIITGVYIAEKSK